MRVPDSISAFTRVFNALWQRERAHWDGSEISVSPSPRASGAALIRDRRDRACGDPASAVQIARYVARRWTTTDRFEALALLTWLRSQAKEPASSEESAESVNAPVA